MKYAKVRFASSRPPLPTTNSPSSWNLSDMLPFVSPPAYGSMTETTPPTFSLELFVDDFGVKYIDKANAQHLVQH